MASFSVSRGGSTLIWGRRGGGEKKVQKEEERGKKPCSFVVSFYPFTKKGRRRGKKKRGEREKRGNRDYTTGCCIFSDVGLELGGGKKKGERK